MDKELIELQTEYLKTLPEKLDQIYELSIDLDKKKNFNQSLTQLKGFIHSIKGSAGSYEINFLSNLCHQFEDQIGYIESGKSDISKNFLFIDLMREYLDFFIPGEESDDSNFINKLKLLSLGDLPSGVSDKKADISKKVLGISFDKFIYDAIGLALSKYKAEVTLIQNQEEVKKLKGKEGFDQLFLDESAQELLSLLPQWKKENTLKDHSPIYLIISKGNIYLPTGNIKLLNKSHHLIRDIKSAFQTKSDALIELPKNILLVDDDESLHPLFQKAFKEFKQIKITTASSSNEAFNIINNGDIDLLILDLMMPDISGKDMYKILQDKGNKIPIIFLTGLSKPEEIKELTNLGAKGVIAKPFKMGTLAGQIIEIWGKN